jgi:hypothetical protein
MKPHGQSHYTYEYLWNFVSQHWNVFIVILGAVIDTSKEYDEYDYPR